jgi:hypothetical protein
LAVDEIPTLGGSMIEEVQLSITLPFDGTNDDCWTALLCGRWVEKEITIKDIERDAEDAA